MSESRGASNHRCSRDARVKGQSAGGFLSPVAESPLGRLAAAEDPSAERGGEGYPVPSCLCLVHVRARSGTEFENQLAKELQSVFGYKKMRTAAFFAPRATLSWSVFTALPKICWLYIATCRDYWQVLFQTYLVCLFLESVMPLGCFNT